jgi:hypothetical protein
MLRSFRSARVAVPALRTAHLFVDFRHPGENQPRQARNKFLAARENAAIPRFVAASLPRISSPSSRRLAIDSTKSMGC